jgi:tetratricopeptide (TPR) repeat protein
VSAGEAGRAIVGRSVEREAIASAIVASRSGRGEVLLFSGEPGIGKSTLAKWAADCAQAKGVAVHWGFAWEAGGAPSYWPWIQLLRSLLAAPSARASSADLGTTLAQLLPELAPRQLAEEQPSLQAEEARFRLMEAVRSLLHRLAADSPFVLILEDLHAADTDSLRLLHYVVRHGASRSFVLIGTFREVDARTSPAMGPLWQAARLARGFRLPRLNEAEMRELFAAMTTPPDERRVRRLLRTSEGNPLFLTELIALFDSRGESDLDVALLPDTMTQVIRRQLERLPGETREVLTVASALGRAFTLADLSLLAGRAAEDVAALLEPAVTADVIRRSGMEGFHFAHILFRDVLHQDIRPAQREEIHRRRAAMLRALVERGEQDRWTELAMHLQDSGRGLRREAVEAWRMAARHAREGLAFDAAVDALARALEIFGEGPGAAPEMRCEVLLDLAEATLAKGDVEAGRQRCADAYRMARVLGDSTLMARAALTYGSVFIAAKVDLDLVDFLRETLERLPPDDTATHVQVAARLAAALQPAPDPAVPMGMARDAIARARTTGDDRVLYRTLRSGVSALMDFAPPEERIVLNREYKTLAERFRDVPEQFRGNLRRMIDAIELGDRQDMDIAIEACDEIARRLDVPHYSWKVASCRAMRAMIRGEFAAASESIDEAERLASLAEDRSARLVLPIQRFGLLRDSDVAPSLSLQELQGDLVKAFVLFPHAEHFVMPRVASFLYQSGDREAADAILRPELVDRALASGDRSSVCALGEIAVYTNDRTLAEKVYGSLSPHREHCSHWGLMGMLWDGPVAYVMALVARSVGRPDEARALLEQALGIAERLQARPIVARIRARLAELALVRGDRGAARGHAERALALARDLGMNALEADMERTLLGVAAKPEERRAPQPAAIEMTRVGDRWRIGFRGRTALVGQSKGTQILYQLVTHPEREFHVLDLYGGIATVEADLGPQLDDRARAAYRQHLVELESELAEAEEMCDIGRAEKAREEMDFLTRELSRAFGLGGRARPAGAAGERARVNVQRRLRDAVRHIGERLPDAGQFLENALKTGTYCSYRPA